MSHLTLNSFSSYHLTDDETTLGSVLTLTQKQVLQNQLATCAEEKLALVFDTEKPQEFVQQEAFKRGQIEMLSYILDCSATAEHTLANPDLDLKHPN